MEARELLSDGRRRLDALLNVRAPDGSSGKVVVEFKRTLDPKDASRVIDRLRSYAQGTPFVASRFLSPRTREILTELGASYADETGNLRFSLERPAVFIRLGGSDRNPWRENRPLQSLKGRTAGRVIRGLCDFLPPFGVRELAERSSTPLGSVSRVIAFLEREAIAEREGRGPVTRVDWPALIRRWSQDYSFTDANRTASFLEPRGLPALLERLGSKKLRYAVTGSLAASKVAPVAPPRLAALFVEDSRAASETLELRATETGPNVILLEPFDRVAFERTWKRDGVIYAALSQVAADLLTSPGRGPGEGQELMAWMEKNEESWRTS